MPVSDGVMRLDGEQKGRVKSLDISDALSGVAAKPVKVRNVPVEIGNKVVENSERRPAERREEDDWTLKVFQTNILFHHANPFFHFTEEVFLSALQNKSLKKLPADKDQRENDKHVAPFNVDHRCEDVSKVDISERANVSSVGYTPYDF